MRARMPVSERASEHSRRENTGRLAGLAASLLACASASLRASTPKGRGRGKRNAVEFVILPSGLIFRG